MVNIRILQTPLTSPSSRILGENDPALDQILALAERSQFVAAGEQTERLWREQVYDVRLLGVFLLASFVEQGMGALADIFSAVNVILGQSWEFVSPTVGKQKQFDVALRWLVTGILGQFRFAQKVKSPHWTAWLSQWDKTDQKQVFDRMSSVSSLLEAVLPGALSRGNLLQFHKTLKDFPTTHADDVNDRQRSTQATAGSDLSSQVIDVEILNGGESNMQSPLEPPKDENPTGSPGAVQSAAVPGAPTTLTIVLSPSLHELMRKVAAFNRLVRLGKFKQAAIVHRDLKEHIEKFDPRLYLPSVFGEYCSNIVTHAEKLLPVLDIKNDFATQALIDLYRMDLDRFIAANG